MIDSLQANIKKILIVGKNSALSRCFVKHWLSQRSEADDIQWQLTFTDHKDNSALYLDMIATDNMADELKEQAFDIAIVFSAFPNIGLCEREPVIAQKINCDAVIDLIKTVRAEHWIVFSTNLVFSGAQANVERSSSTNPQVQYGKTKAMLELAINSLFPDRVAIIRMTKIVFPGMQPLTEFLSQLQQGKEVAVFRDMVMAPVFASDVCRFLVGLCRDFRAGIYQLSAQEDISYYDATAYMARNLKLSLDKLKGVTKTIWSPKNTSLRVDSIENAYGFYSPSATKALDLMMKYETLN